MQALFEQFARWKFCEVLGDMNSAWFERKDFNRLVLLAGTKNQADRLVLAFLPLMAVQPTQIELHLPGVGRLQIADLKFDDHQPPQASMVEEQIEIVIVPVEGYALLSLDEGEAAAEFQQKGFDLAQQRVLEILLAVGVLQRSMRQNSA